MKLIERIQKKPKVQIQESSSVVSRIVAWWWLSLFLCVIASGFFVYLDANLFMRQFEKPLADKYESSLVKIPNVTNIDSAYVRFKELQMRFEEVRQEEASWLPDPSL